MEGTTWGGSCSGNKLEMGTAKGPVRQSRTPGESDERGTEQIEGALE